MEADRRHAQYSHTRLRRSGPRNCLGHNPKRHSQTDRRHSRAPGQTSSHGLMHSYTTKIWFALILLAGCATLPRIADPPQAQRAHVSVGTRATYCSAPRKADGRVDADRLVSELVAAGANTYSFCIHAYPTDWDDLKLLLPLAREH